MVGNEKENMENSRVLVVGLGRSGIAAAEALKRPESGCKRVRQQIQ